MMMIESIICTQTARLRNMTYGFTIHYDVVMKIKILIDKDDRERQVKINLRFMKKH